MILLMKSTKGTWKPVENIILTRNKSCIVILVRSMTDAEAEVLDTDRFYSILIGTHCGLSVALAIV